MKTGRGGRRALRGGDRLPPCMPPPLQVIREGRPCHLYFDLEFQKELNPRVNGAVLTDILLEHVEQTFRWGRLAGPLEGGCFRAGVWGA